MPKSERNPKAECRMPNGATGGSRRGEVHFGIILKTHIPRGCEGRFKLSGIVQGWSESGRGQPHSKTLREIGAASVSPTGLGVRLPSAAFVRLASPYGSDRAQLSLTGCNSRFNDSTVQRFNG